VAEMSDRIFADRMEGLIRFTHMGVECVFPLDPRYEPPQQLPNELREKIRLLLRKNTRRDAKASPSASQGRTQLSDCI